MLIYYRIELEHIVKRSNLYFLFLILPFSISFAQKNYEDFAQKYTGMGALSEIVMSHKCIVRNNFNLFYESNVKRNELQRTLVWYKLVFHQACKLSFNIIPNNESDRYELEVYKADVNFDICSGEISSGFSKQDSLSKSINYTDSAQSATFRGSLFHTREIEVGHQEVVYIIVNNLSGPDMGHVIDLQTCDYSYILKMNKESIADEQKFNRNELETPFLRLKAIEKKLCQSEDDKKLGYSSFLGESMKVKNFSARSLDSASKQQAKAVRVLDSIAKRPLVDLSINSNSITGGKTNNEIPVKKSDTLVTSDSVSTFKKLSQRDSMQKDLNSISKNDLVGDSILTSTMGKKLIKDVSIFNDSVSKNYNNQLNRNNGLNQNPNVDSISSKVISENKPMNPTVLTSHEWQSIYDFYFSRKESVLPVSVSKKNIGVLMLNDSLFNYFFSLKSPGHETEGGENANVKTRKRRVSVGNLVVQLIAVDAVSHQVLNQPDIKLFKGKSKRGFRLLHSDTLHGSRIEFQNANGLIVRAKVFGYLPYEENFDTINCFRFHDTLYDFLFLQPLKKGDILDLPNVFFQPNTTVLKQSSYRELDKLVDYLNSNNFRVRVNGHTQGNKRIINKSPNLAPEYKFKGTAMRLSKKRADRVLNYLVEKGIDRKRISTRGYAGRKPKVKHPKSKSERELNMRVEVEILK
jgi:outer membrane protein OmpA-like peptidoglycan-associated protein